MKPLKDEIYFEVQTPLNFKVRVTQGYWELIVTIKHPVMRGHEEDVKTALIAPDEIRRSRSDLNVYLFYKNLTEKVLICVVTKRLNQSGFIITTYPTNSIKEGEKIWSK